MAASSIPMAAPPTTTTTTQGAEDNNNAHLGDGEAALQRLRSTDPPLYLSQSPELASAARSASSYLFSSIVPFCSGPSHPAVDSLLVDKDFDTEQIWSQIDLLARPLLSLLRREVSRIERNPSRLAGLISNGHGGETRGRAAKDEEKPTRRTDAQGKQEEEEDGSVDESEGDDEEDEEAAEEEEEDESDEDEGEEEEEEKDGGTENANGVEDQFLKIKELEEYLKKGEEDEYGLPERKREKKEEESDEEDDEDENDEDEDDDDNEDKDLELDELDGDDDEELESAENARYEDFFGGRKRKELNKKHGGEKKKGSSDEFQIFEGSEDVDMQDQPNNDKDKKVLSTHEKELQKLRVKIEQLEKANIEPKSWTMQGEVTAAKRPKNSALEVDLDFEHNVRPAPQITEEATASLEDLIRKRIIEGQFDDVQRALPSLSKAPKERKELDETKSKKGLAELYEEEYAQKTGLTPAPISVSDEFKKEADILFKKLCSKLDALSHFHFAPKPIIEDMSIQANVPALAMEEIAPLAVSDAAMLAPEEIFEGKGDIKEESELTKEDRKRRRANKKRKFKAHKRVAKKETEKVVPSNMIGSKIAAS